MSLLVGCAGPGEGSISILSVFFRPTAGQTSIEGVGPDSSGQSAWRLLGGVPGRLEVRYFSPNDTGYGSCDVTLGGVESIRPKYLAGSLSTGSDFLLVGGTRTLVPGTEAQGTVTCSGDNFGYKDATADFRVRVLVGVAVTTDPTEFAFGSVQVGNSVTREVVVTNVGASTMTSTAMRLLDQESAAHFSVNGTDCSRRNVPPGGSCVIAVVYRPRITGLMVNMLSITVEPVGAGSMGVPGTVGVVITGQATPEPTPTPEPPPPQQDPHQPPTG